MGKKGISYRLLAVKRGNHRPDDSGIVLTESALSSFFIGNDKLLLLKQMYD
jgi:hypothetical protein